MPTMEYLASIVRLNICLGSNCPYNYAWNMHIDIWNVIKRSLLFYFNSMENGEKKLKDLVHMQRSKRVTAGSNLFKPLPKTKPGCWPGSYLLHLPTLICFILFLSSTPAHLPSLPSYVKCGQKSKDSHHTNELCTFIN